MRRLPRSLCAALAAVALVLTAVAAQAEEPALVVIVSVENTETPDANDIGLIFKRRRGFWHGGARIQPVNLPLDHAARQLFTRNLLRLSPDALEEFWNEQYFHGVTPPHVLASEPAVLRFVADTATAIGYLGGCPHDPRVRPVLALSAEGRRLPSAAAACPG